MSSDYQLLPPLSDEEYARLRDDIAQRGVMVPIEVDEHGNVLDGHHRKRIAEELGIGYRTIPRPGLAEHEKRLHAVALNLNRRHLTDAQKVTLGRTIEPDIAEAAEVRRLANLRQAPSVTNVALGRTEDQVAAAVGLGTGRTYERGKKVIEKAEKVAPELLPQVDSGALSINDVRKAVNAKGKAARVAAIAAVPAADVAALGAFPVLYADPPWRYEDAEPTRAVENHYPTMTLAEIAALDVPAADDSVLFLWATSPKLTEALAVLDAWGFEYRTCLVWVKDKIGMGYYARQRHELLLVGKRGELPVPEPSDRPDSVIEAPRLAHSAKPEVVYDLIECMYPAYQRCELFARTERDGWTGYGNELPRIVGNVDPERAA